jgi:hypothetical protein
MMQQMLMQRLQQNPQAPNIGGQQAQVSPLQGGAQLVQKLMLMKALQNAPQTPGGATGQQQHQANAMVPGTSAQIASDPTMSALQSPQMNPALLQQLQGQPPPIADPSLQPIPGYS